MPDGDQVERWQRIEADLRVALRLLHPCLSCSAVKWVEEYLDHNELGLAFEVLIESLLVSELTALPTGVLSPLRRAHREMGQRAPDLWAQFTARFA